MMRGRFMRVWLPMLILLDTNVYLRLAKRIRPLLEARTGQQKYRLVVLPDIEDEVCKSPRLQFHFPWFEDPEVARDRRTHRVRLSKEEKVKHEVATGILHEFVLDNADLFAARHQSPPSRVDCRVLAFAQVKGAVAATDDNGMHTLAKEFDIKICYGHESLRRMWTSKMIGTPLVKEIYEALENNRDLPQSWAEAKHKRFAKVFGRRPKGHSCKPQR